MGEEEKEPRATHANSLMRDKARQDAKSTAPKK